MNFLIDFLIGSLITISGEQVISPTQKSPSTSPVPGIAASAPSTAASAIPVSIIYIPTVAQMKDKV